jgi:NAD(P)-dependent dehydrogenase (short-subunit alcohol dehydrogenase family)
MTESGVAVVTGGNRGIGLEVCRQLAAAGRAVAMAARDANHAAGAARALGVQVRALDVADPASIQSFAQGLRDDGLAVSALINNAGISLNGFDAGMVAGSLAVNYFGAAAVTDALLPLMSRGARIVMVSSGMGELDGLPPATRERLTARGLDRPGLDAVVRSFIDDVRAGVHRKHGWPSNAYGFSKAALNTLVRIIAPELAARGIKVNAVCPGWVRTDMGGASAPRSVEQGARGVVWAATLGDDGPTGGFFRDGRAIDW